jgi:hypothetical protein
MGRRVSKVTVKSLLSIDWFMRTAGNEKGKVVSSFMAGAELRLRYARQPDQIAVMNKLG